MIELGATAAASVLVSAPFSSIKATFTAGNDVVTAIGQTPPPSPPPRDGGMSSLVQAMIASIKAADGLISALSHTGGVNTDSLNVNFAGRIAALTTQLGDGDDSVVLGDVSNRGLKLGGIKIVRASSSANNDQTIFHNLIVSGGVKVQMGSAKSNIAITESLFGAAVGLDLGDGNAAVNIETGSGGVATVFRGPVSILMGAGDDILNIGANTATGHAEFESTASFDGGAGGNDIAHVSAALLANIYPAAQPTLPSFETKDRPHSPFAAAHATCIFPAT